VRYRTALTGDFGADIIKQAKQTIGPTRLRVPSRFFVFNRAMALPLV